MIEFNFTYSGFEVEKLDGLPPRVKINLELRVQDLHSTSEIISVYFPEIKYIAKVVSLMPDSSSPRTEITIGESNSPQPLCIRAGHMVNTAHNPAGTHLATSFYLDFRTKVLERILDLRIRGKTIGLRINAETYFQVYKHEKNYHLLNEVLEHGTKTIESTGINRTVIVLSPEDLNRLIADMHYTDILKIELPLFNEISNANQSIKDATRHLQSAAEKFIAGNYRATLVDIRNAILNDLTEIGANNRRVLKKDLRERYMAEVPQQSVNSYRKVLRNVESQIIETLSVVHKFVHEDDEKLLLLPMRQDLEFIFFNIALITRHLAQGTDQS